MIKLKLKGHYKHQGNIGPLEGIIEVNELNEFQGTINDKISISPEQSIKGKYIQENNISKLLIFKFHPKDNYANLFYEVEKQNDGKIIGEYHGKWKALGNKINQEGKFDEILRKTNTNNYIMSDLAEINLSE